MGEEYIEDDWPDGFDGTGLFRLVQDNKSPFSQDWDVKQLFEEVEQVLGTTVTDVPVVEKGSNNYGFHLKLSNHPDVVARLARGDVNMPNFDGFAVESQVSEIEFEAAVYHSLQSEPSVATSRLLHFRVPTQTINSRQQKPNDILGRRLMLFERAEGESYQKFKGLLSGPQSGDFLDHAASVRASLFDYDPPSELIHKWCIPRLFEDKPVSFPSPLEPTRRFSVDLLKTKVEQKIGNIGDAIGWESDKQVVGPTAFAAKALLLQLIPHIVPQDGSSLRLVLDHLDYGIHNTLIAKDQDGKARISSVFDWETACVVPAFLSDPLFAVTSVDLIVGRFGVPSIARLPDELEADKCEEYAKWSKRYFETLYKKTPSYQHAIKSGEDARHLWFALRRWRGEDPEGYFGRLGTWAQRRMKELGVKELGGN